MLDYKNEIKKYSEIKTQCQTQLEDLENAARKICIANNMKIGFSGAVSAIYANLIVKTKLEYIKTKKYSVVKQRLKNHPGNVLYFRLRNKNKLRKRIKWCEMCIALLNYIWLHNARKAVIDFTKENKIGFDKLHYKRHQDKLKIAFPDFRIHKNAFDSYLIYCVDNINKELYLNANYSDPPEFNSIDQLEKYVADYVENINKIQDALEQIQKDVKKMESNFPYFYGNQSDVKFYNVVDRIKL